jgi:hypothetical protein
VGDVRTRSYPKGNGPGVFKIFGHAVNHAAAPIEKQRETRVKIIAAGEALGKVERVLRRMTAKGKPRAGWRGA